jgi:hypothetical protein
VPPNAGSWTTPITTERLGPVDNADIMMSMGKYDSLAAYLERVDGDRSAVTLSFRDVDRMVRGLPPSAYRLRQWWANDSKVEARAWRSAGWDVDEGGVDFNAQTVRFARGKVCGTRARRLGLE